MSADLEWNGQATLGHAFLRKGREVEGNGMGQWSTMLHIWHTINPREERELPEAYVFISFPGKQASRTEETESQTEAKWGYEACESHLHSGKCL